MYSQDHANVWMGVTPAPSLRSTASSRANTPFGPTPDIYNPHEVNFLVTIFDRMVTYKECEESNTKIV